MSQSARPRACGARSTRRAAVIAAVAVALAGCGSTSPSKPVSHPSATAKQPLAAAPAHKPGPRVNATDKSGTTRGTPTVARKPSPVDSTPCSAGEKLTVTDLCYSPAAQKTLVAKLGPCPAGQVVADNGACQPLTSGGPPSQPVLPARCRGLRRTACIPRGSLQGGGLKNAGGPGFDTVFH